MNDRLMCRICGLGVHIVDTEIGPILMHVSEAMEADHSAVEDNGTYWVR